MSGKFNPRKEKISQQGQQSPAISHLKPLKSGKDRIICFHIDDANEQGTEVAKYDYSDYVETILGHTSKILLPDIPKVRQGRGLSKYQARFGNNTIFYSVIKGRTNGHIVTAVAKKNSCDIMYFLKAGDRGSFPTWPKEFDESQIRYAIHAVFTWQNHGPTIPMAAISSDVTKGIGGRQIVPHIVRPPSQSFKGYTDVLRNELEIPKSALVICRHGAMDSFNLPFVHRVVFDLVQTYDKSKLAFVFLGTAQFGPKHGQIYFLPTTSDIDYKEKFIASCDVMLHARDMGESFGLAVAEFSVRNKPVITYPGTSQEHIRILGKKGYVYHNSAELTRIVDSFVANGVNKTKDYNAYADYAPDIVIQQFRKVFIEPYERREEGN